MIRYIVSATNGEFMALSITQLMGMQNTSPKQSSIDPLNKDVIVALASMFDIPSLEKVNFNTDTFSMTITRSEVKSQKRKTSD